MRTRICLRGEEKDKVYQLTRGSSIRAGDLSSGVAVMYIVHSMLTNGINQLVDITDAVVTLTAGTQEGMHGPVYGCQAMQLTLAADRYIGKLTDPKVEKGQGMEALEGIKASNK